MGFLYMFVLECLEWLEWQFLNIFMQETEGVCVATFGESKDFPSFFTSRSGHNAPWRVADAHEAASLIGGIFPQ